jgi:formate hydrogenlyase transcriptional activator
MRLSSADLAFPLDAVLAAPDSKRQGKARSKKIPLLVEYFIDRFARKAGKRFQTMNKKSLTLLEAYPWPGNFRELQNVIKRSVVICETENFSVDESWLSRRSIATGAKVELANFANLRGS